MVIAQQKEENYLIMQRYQREDERKIRMMLFELERVAALVREKGRKVDDEIMTTRSLRIGINSTAEQFHKKHEELQDQIDQLPGVMEDKLELDSLDKSRVKTRKKGQVLEQFDILLLQVDKLSEQVVMKNDDLVSLKNRRQQFQFSMEERILEIDAHITSLRIQLKTEEEAPHNAMTKLLAR